MQLLHTIWNGRPSDLREPLDDCCSLTWKLITGQTLHFDSCDQIIGAMELWGAVVDRPTTKIIEMVCKGYPIELAYAEGSINIQIDLVVEQTISDRTYHIASTRLFNMSSDCKVTMMEFKVLSKKPAPLPQKN